MNLPPQPPPDVPAPPPGPEARRSRQVMDRIIAAGGLSIVILVLLGLASLMGFNKKRPPHQRSGASSNARQLHLSLLNFDNDYGCFPDASTIADVRDHTGTTLPLGTSSSNGLLRQLIAAGGKSEKVFWAYSAVSPREPDDVIRGTRALDKGECGFAYVYGLSSTSDPNLPLLMTPVDPAGRRFERSEAYENKAVVLFVDGSVKYLPLDKHGHAQLNGMNLFDPRQPFWKGKLPDIKWPE